MQKEKHKEEQPNEEIKQNEHNLRAADFGRGARAFIKINWQPIISFLFLTIGCLAWFLATQYFNQSRSEYERLEIRIKENEQKMSDIKEWMAVIEGYERDKKNEAKRANDQKDVERINELFRKIEKIGEK